jgi:hypothetical protein
MFVEKAYLSFANTVFGCIHIVLILWIIGETGWKYFVLKQRIENAEKRRCLVLAILFPVGWFFMSTSNVFAHNDTVGVEIPLAYFFGVIVYSVFTILILLFLLNSIAIRLIPTKPVDDLKHKADDMSNPLLLQY